MKITTPYGNEDTYQFNEVRCSKQQAIRIIQFQSLFGNKYRIISIDNFKTELKMDNFEAIKHLKQVSERKVYTFFRAGLTILTFVIRNFHYKLMAWENGLFGGVFYIFLSITMIIANVLGIIAMVQGKANIIQNFLFLLSVNAISFVGYLIAVAIIVGFFIGLFKLIKKVVKFVKNFLEWV